MQNTEPSLAGNREATTDGESTRRSPGLQRLALGLAVVLMAGTLLWLGRELLVPIIAAFITLYILSAATARLMRYPPFRGRSHWPARWTTLVLFTAISVALFYEIVTTAGAIAERLPEYEANFDTLIADLAARLGLSEDADWTHLKAATIDRVHVSDVLPWILSELGALSGQVFLIALYCGFFFAERQQLPMKVTAATGDRTRGDEILGVLRKANDRIGAYLLVKAMVNCVLAVASFAVLLVLGVDFALFWAVLIGLLNFIPYVGSILAVFFPVVLALAESGSLWFGGLVFAGLTLAQIVVGSWLEPRMMGRRFGISPAVVILSLSFWSLLWGLPGAILAVPMTAALMIFLDQFRETRWVAIMLSGEGNHGLTRPPDLGGAT